MLKFLKSTVVCVGLLTASSLAIAPWLTAQPAGISIQLAYSKLDVNAIDLYYSEPVEVESSDSEEVVDLETTPEDSSMDDASEESTSLQ